MEKVRPLVGTRPDWYIGKEFVDIPYLGSLARIPAGMNAVTPDGEYIVSRADDTRLQAVENRCRHKGSRIYSPGMHSGESMRCPLHSWTYGRDGVITHAPGFRDFAGCDLRRPPQAMWNGFLLGTPDASALHDFGRTLGFEPEVFSASNYVYVGEYVPRLPYPGPIMAHNYVDGHHIRFAHGLTFGPVADTDTYKWEFGPDADAPLSYSIQLVNARENVREVAERTLVTENARRRKMKGLVPELRLHELGWANLHLSLNGMTFSSPYSRKHFAVWVLIYPYIMLEYYEGGLFLAVSYLTKDGNDTAINPVEYYVHKEIHEGPLRNELAKKFAFAYPQSAKEDDALCEMLFAGHKKGVSFPAYYHEILEGGDSHLIEWFLAHEKK